MSWSHLTERPSVSTFFVPAVPMILPAWSARTGPNARSSAAKHTKFPRQRSLSHCTGSGASYDSVIFLVIDLVNLVDSIVLTSVGPPRIQPTVSNATTVGPKNPPRKRSLSVRVVGTGWFSFTFTGSKWQIISPPRQLLRL